jgi:hypothetical protein
VEVAKPPATPTRVGKDSCLVADCRTIEEVALIVDLATRGAEAPHPR